MAVGAIEPQFFAKLISGLGLAKDAVPNQFDLGRYDEMKAIFTERFATRTRDEWAVVFAGTDACATPVLTWTEAAANEHLAARSTVITVDGVQQAAPAPRFSRTSAGPVGTPPKGTTAVDRIGW
jgi:alpha-methylacyl-CoA racemase